MIIDFTIQARAQNLFNGQNETGKMVRDVTKNYHTCRWILGQGNLHTWRVKCNEEEAVMLSLLSEKVSYDFQNKMEEGKKSLIENITIIQRRIAQINEIIGVT